MRKTANDFIEGKNDDPIAHFKIFSNEKMSQIIGRQQPNNFFDKKLLIYSALQTNLDMLISSLELLNKAEGNIGQTIDKNLKVYAEEHNAIDTKQDSLKRRHFHEAQENYLKDKGE